MSLAISWLLLAVGVESFMISEVREVERPVLELQVNYGEELANLLRQAADQGKMALVKDILEGEIDNTEKRVRERAFTYMQDGVSSWGEDVSTTKDIIDKIKAVLNETLLLLDAARPEISSFLEGVKFQEEEVGKTLVDILAYIRSVGELAEKKYKDTVSGFSPLQI